MSPTALALPPDLYVAQQLKESIADLRAEAKSLDFGMRETAKREYVKGGYLLALEHLERRIVGPSEGNGSLCRQ